MKFSGQFFQDMAVVNRTEARHMLKALADNQTRMQLGPEFDEFRVKIQEARVSFEAGITAIGASEHWGV